jgi:NADH-quinone oxidoreductase subunit F
MRTHAPQATNGRPQKLSETAIEQISALATRYPDKLAAAIPALYVAQDDLGYVSLDAMQQLADALGIPQSHVYGVATFYTMFRKSPVGRFHIEVCTNLCCALKGGAKIFERLQTRLGLQQGEVSKDGGWSLAEAECLGSCATGPCLQINHGEYDELLDDASLDEVIEACKADRILPWGQPEPAAFRTKPDHCRYSFEGYSSEKFPNFLLRGAGNLDNWRLSVYEGEHEGYQALRKAIRMQPKDVVQELKASGLRGRGGAGFPTGLKWSFMPQDTPENKHVRYLVANADEGEPGTFKDRAILECNPHQLIEGMLIAAWAMQCCKGFIYFRGEFGWLRRKMDAAIQEAREAGYLGAGILGSSLCFDLDTFRGAGAYVCGEETALLNSLEGRRGEPRPKPPFPAAKGAFGRPTTVNNVETLASVPAALRIGGQAYSAIGVEKNAGTRLFGLSGQIKNPGLYELPMGTPLRYLVETIGGGTPSGLPIKAIIPGGISAPVLTPDQMDTQMDFDSMQKMGSMAGSGGVIVMDESTCMVQAALRAMRFYAHESCGQCTPCREGIRWAVMILTRIEQGHGRKGDIELLESIASRINTHTLCPLGDAACGPLESMVRKFRREFEEHIEKGQCPFKKSMLLAEAKN